MSQTQLQPKLPGEPQMYLFAEWQPIEAMGNLPVGSDSIEDYAPVDDKHQQPINGSPARWRARLSPMVFMCWGTKRW